MAKRGRKPSLEKKGFYFQEIEEQAVADYLNCENEVEKNRIFKEVLQPALYKMVESIIRRYKLYPPQDENFDENKSYHEDYFAVVAWEDELYRYFEVVKQNKEEVIR